MVNKCSAYGCKSGYDSVGKENEGVSFHSFPLNNPVLCGKWIKANPRRDFVPGKYSKMCSLHFLSTDFVAGVKDTNKTRIKKRSESNKAARPKSKLREDAVPSIFPNAPSYLSTPKQVRSTSKSSSSVRREFQQKQLEELEIAFDNTDVINKCTLSELENRLKTETTMPSGYHLHIIDYILHIMLLDNHDESPFIKLSLSISSTFDVIV